MISVGKVELNVGAVVSSMVNVAIVVAVRPQPSVAVKVTIVEPVAPQLSLNPEKSLDQVILPQLSEATAPPLLFNQALRSLVLPLPSHSTV